MCPEPQCWGPSLDRALKLASATDPPSKSKVQEYRMSGEDTWQRTLAHAINTYYTNRPHIRTLAHTHALAHTYTIYHTNNSCTQYRTCKFFKNSFNKVSEVWR